MHGATSWRDYFKVNTDHKVIGTQYLVIVFFFFVIGGIFAELVRDRAGDPRARRSATRRPTTACSASTRR